MVGFKTSRSLILGGIVLMVILWKPVVAGYHWVVNGPNRNPASQTLPQLDSLIPKTVPRVDKINRAEVENLLSSRH